MIKTLFTIILTLTFALHANAQQANDILDKAAQKFKSYKSVKSQYYVNMTNGTNSQRIKGAIIFQGNKYVNAYADNIIWFNGKTLWTLVKANQEVTVINPTQKELAANNPYYYFTNYKDKFKAEIVKQNAKVWTIKLTPLERIDGTNSVIVDIDKTEYRPTQVQLDSKEGKINIQVTTFVTNKAYKSSSFSFDKKKYPDIDIIDLR